MKIDKVILHCSDSPHGRGDGAEEIHRWHSEKGWDGIGYHYVITEDGAIQNGRPDYWQGAHARGNNENSLGICLIGIAVFTTAQFEALATLLIAKMDEYGFTSDKIIGHCDVSSKTCPNFSVEDFKKRYGKGIL